MRTRRFLWSFGGVWLSVMLAVGLLWGSGHDASAGVILYGDANCDGRANSIDSSVILQLDAGIITGLACPGNADVNGDGRSNSVDASIILQFDAGLISHIGPASTNTPTRTKTPTATPTTVSTSTPTTTPVSGSCSLTFASYYSEPDQFCGTVTQITEMSTIPGGGFGDATAPPGGTFAVVFMTVTNTSSKAHNIGIFSFRLRDAQDRIFTMDFFTYPELLSAQITAEDHFGLRGLYATIFPGLTENLVFVLLVPADTTGLAAERVR
jgi:hypothetical protein